MTQPTIDDLLAPILLSDKRYTAEAYLFIRGGLEHTVRQLDKPRHVNGQELLEGIRVYALKEYGPVTRRVLSEWGINNCIDIGNIVFNLVSEGLLGKTEEDSIEDFLGGYDFIEAFVEPFRPGQPTVCELETSPASSK